MKSQGDAVLEHLGKYKNAGTSDILELLELSNDDDNVCAANLYVAALEIIVKLQKRVKELEDESGGKTSNQ